MDVIIGAGISGLSYAAATTHDYIILEAEDQIGGYCKTVYQGDYIWDYSGHFFHFQHEEIKNLVMSHLQADEVLQVEKHTQIYYSGNDGVARMIDYPFQMNIHQLCKDEFVECLCDLFLIDESKPIETFKQMLHQKFGEGIANKFLIPYNEKLYAVDLDALSVDAMGRFFPYANKEEIIRNFRRSSNQSYNSFFLYPKRGAVRIIDAVAESVDKSKICLGEKVLQVDCAAHLIVTNRRTIHYDNLISTMPLPNLLDLCNIDYNRKIYSWNKVLVFNLGFDSKGPERTNDWIYYPNKDVVFYRVGFYDNIIGQDKTSVYVEIGFNKDTAITNIEDWLHRVLSDLQKVGAINQQHLVAEHHIILDPAYVHISTESELDKQHQMSILQKEDIYSIGRYGAWKYCSLEDNIQDAITLARSF